jgi:D-alanine-D-alanine ligase
VSLPEAGRGPVAIVYSDVADPRGYSHGEEVSPAHVVREEIPVIEETLLGLGREVVTVPIGADFLESTRRLRLRAPRTVINLCEDLLGDSAHEIHFAALMELTGLPYTGSPPLTLGLCRDKGKTKSILRHHDIPTPDFIVVRNDRFATDDLSYPLFVKPAAEDGSLGIDDSSLVGDEDSLRRKVNLLLGSFGEVMIEEYVPGRELNVAILGTSPERVLPVSEIDFSGLPDGCPAICGYEAKWDGEDIRCRETVPLCPASLEVGDREQLERLSLAVYHLLGLRDYARIDWRLSRERGLQFLEANPNPDISPSSGFMRSLRAAGMDYPEFLSFLLEVVEARSARR